MRLLKLLLLILVVCAAGPAVAGPFEDGAAAYAKGDYGTALRLWRPLAEQGDARGPAEHGEGQRCGVGPDAVGVAEKGFFHGGNSMRKTRGGQRSARRCHRHGRRRSLSGIYLASALTSEASKVASVAGILVIWPLALSSWPMMSPLA